MSFKEFLEEAMISDKHKVGKLYVLTNKTSSGNQYYTIHSYEDDSQIDTKKYQKFTLAVTAAKNYKE